MKKFFLTFLIFFLSSKVSFACDITFVNFGDKSDKLMENPGSLPFEDEFKGKFLFQLLIFVLTMKN